MLSPAFAIGNCRIEPANALLVPLMLPASNASPDVLSTSEAKPLMIVLDKPAVLDMLKPVLEPESGRSIVELGMVKDVRIDDREIHLLVELLTPATPHREGLEHAIRETIQRFEPDREVFVEFASRVRPSSAGRMDAQPLPGVKNAVAVASGKGGVGKSTVAVNLAVALARSGAKVGLLDADVYGPSTPLMLGAHGKPQMQNQKIVPLEAHGIKVMSVGFILDPEKALIWRGPLVAQLITQFLNDVEWGELDYLIIDLPPGTGDVQLTLVQKIPISGAVIVTTPQEVALADAVKGLKMFEEVKTPIIGIIENMSGFVCPSCGVTHDIFDSGGGKRIAELYGVDLLGQIPLDIATRISGDTGVPVTLAYPDSPAGKAFQHTAERVAGKLAADAANKPRKPLIMMKTVG